MSSPSMTKEQLKSALVQNRIPLPPTSAKKEEFQRLYDEKVAPLQSRSEFSSDEETEPEKVQEQEQEAANGFISSWAEIKQMSDEQLYGTCVEIFGRDKIGPVLDNTRVVYQNKLANFFSLRSSPSAAAAVASSPLSSTQVNGSSTNGTADTHENNGANGYSDSDEEVETASRSSRSTRGKGSPARGSSKSKTHGSGTSKAREITHDIEVESGTGTPIRRRGVPAATVAPSTRKSAPVTRNLSEHKTFSETTSTSAMGASYFKERSAYSSTNALPMKSTANIRGTGKTEYRDHRETDELKYSEDTLKHRAPRRGRQMTTSIQMGIFAVAIVAVVIGMYYFKESIMSLVGISGGGGESEVDELDEYLESLKESNNYGDL